MKTLNHSKLLLSAILLAMICFCSFAQQQMPVQKMSDIEKLIDSNSGSKLQRKTEDSFVKSNVSNQLDSDRKFELKIRKSKKAEKEICRPIDVIENEVIVESEIGIEGWMLQTFEKENPSETEALDTEDDIELESWMTDLNLWD